MKEAKIKKLPRAKKPSIYGKMNQKAKKEWVKALTSGKFKQVRSRLKTVDRMGEHSYCCLGVLSELQKVENRKPDFSYDYEFDFPGMGELRGSIPDGFCGVNQTAISKLINMNDDNKKTFEQIAKWIEKNL